MNTEIGIYFIGACLIFAVAMIRIQIILLAIKDEIIRIRKGLVGDKK